LPEASEGIMGRSGLVVMVEVMFISAPVGVADVACVERGGRKASGAFGMESLHITVFLKGD
jgi:hypothetical protein